MLDPMQPDPRETKLPHWAQGIIDDLRRKTRSAETAAEEARLATNPDGSNTFVDRFQVGDIGLGWDTAIKFQLGAGWEQHLRVRIDNGQLNIHGGRGIVIQPQSSNGVSIVTRD